MATLKDVFEPLNGSFFASQERLEEAVSRELSHHLGSLPAGFTPDGAVKGAKQMGWLETNDSSGVTVRLSAQSQRSPTSAGPYRIPSKRCPQNWIEPA